MKKRTISILVIAVVFCAALIVSCGTSGGSGANSGANSGMSTSNAAASNDIYDILYPVIDETFIKISEKLTPGMRIALLPPGSTDKAVGQYVFDELYIMFVDSGLYDMVDRTDIDRVLQEQNFQASGLVDDRTAVQFAQLLGAEAIAFGDIPELGSTRQRLVYRSLDVETGRMLAISSQRF